MKGKILFVWFCAFTALWHSFSKDRPEGKDLRGRLTLPWQSASRDGVCRADVAIEASSCCGDSSLGGTPPKPHVKGQGPLERLQSTEAEASQIPRHTGVWQTGRGQLAGRKLLQLLHRKGRKVVGRLGWLSPLTVCFWLRL